MARNAHKPVPPTARQDEILRFIRRQLEASLRPPTLDEIRRHFGWRSTNAARSHLALMEKKGLVTIDKKSHRGIGIPGPGTASGAARAAVKREIPMLGDAPAGSPVEAVELANETVAVDTGLFPHAGLFAIRVRGASMTGAGIHDRDIALIQHGSETKDGDIVLARLNGEVTVKRLLYRDATPRLHAENPAYTDILIQPWDSFEVVGKVVGIIRVV